MAASPWAGEREAVGFGPVSFQPMDPLAVRFPSTECNFYHPGAEQSEDCLYLNVWAPAERQAQLRPVLIWIHGGAYVCGSGSGLWTDGTRLAAEQDVVVVTLNYRLGALGGLAVDDDARSANNMLRDQLGALRWTQENITAFGGDPKRVTIAGESAGAFCVINLMACPEAQGTFQRAIAQSGHAYAPTAAPRKALDANFWPNWGYPTTPTWLYCGPSTRNVSCTLRGHSHQRCPHPSALWSMVRSAPPRSSTSSSAAAKPASPS